VTNKDEQRFSKEPYRSLTELAAVLNVSRMTVWRWAKEGRIDVVRIGRLYRISDESFQRILKQGIK
jgi:excisionase family DNA binding protein